MIDTAIPDTVGEGLINFDKRRKEFEVLAQVDFFFLSFLIQAEFDIADTGRIRYLIRTGICWLE